MKLLQKINNLIYYIFICPFILFDIETEEYSEISEEYEEYEEDEESKDVNDYFTFKIK